MAHPRSCRGIGYLFLSLPPGLCNDAPACRGAMKIRERFTGTPRGSPSWSRARARGRVRALKASWAPCTATGGGLGLPGKKGSGRGPLGPYAQSVTVSGTYREEEAGDRHPSTRSPTPSSFPLPAGALPRDGDLATAAVDCAVERTRTVTARMSASSTRPREHRGRPEVRRHQVRPSVALPGRVERRALKASQGSAC